MRRCEDEPAPPPVVDRGQPKARRDAAHHAMPTITIDGKVCEFTQGETIIKVALDNGIEIPNYCYHQGLSIVASCRICLAEVWAPNPRNDNKLEPIPKLVPACQTHAADAQDVTGAVPPTEHTKRQILNREIAIRFVCALHPRAEVRVVRVCHLASNL